MKRTLAVLVLLLAAGAAIWLLNREQPIQVPLVEVSRGPVEVIAANSRAGSVRACQRSRLSMPVGGRVEQLLVEEGDRVKAGELLLQLHDDEQQALVAQARADLQAAELEHQRSCQQAAFSQRELTRSRTLAARNLVSAEQLDRLATESRLAGLACEQGQVAIEQSRARLDLHRAQLDKMALRAPFAGIIAEINGEPGEYITPSPPGVATPPAVDLIDDSCLYVRAPIDEVEAARLQTEQPARITLDAFRELEFQGTLHRIAPYVSELEKQARTVDVDVHFTPVPSRHALLVGYSADVEIILEHHDDVLRIPTDTLLEQRYVLRYDPDSSTLQRIDVETGPANWSWTAVSAGLQAGDRILARLDIDGAEAGARVEVLSAESAP